MWLIFALICVSLYVVFFVTMCVLSLVAGPYEELIASHGVVEEYFAFDATLVIVALVCQYYAHTYRGDQLMNSSRGRGHRANKRQGLPPITPNACVRDTVGSQVFDLIWAEVDVFWGFLF